MLSYQHKYHVGNHADVLKHLCWVSVIRYLNEKDKPYVLVDTHAGEGRYILPHGDEHESDLGAKKLVNIQTSQPDLDVYINYITACFNNNYLPGSPAVAEHLMRDQDEMHCIELHPQAYLVLKQFTKSSSQQIHSHSRDAFEGLKAIIPPKVKRGAIIIDPPYEQIQEYQHVKLAVKDAMTRWATSQILVWVPLLGSRSPQKASEGKKLIESLFELKTTQLDVVKVELILDDKKSEQGMYGSVLVVINPYWKFKESIAESLAQVVPYLGSQSRFQVV